MLTSAIVTMLALASAWLALFFAYTAYKIHRASSVNLDRVDRLAGGTWKVMTGSVDSKHGNVRDHYIHAGLVYKINDGSLIEQGMLSDDAIDPIMSGR
jgi:hypothetical protein